MAKCKLSARELAGQIFSPRVAVLTSPAAQALCETNGLNFTQLIQPFTSLTTFQTWQEPTGGQIAPKCLKISPVDIASWKPPAVLDTQRNRQIQYGIVSQSPPPLRVIDHGKSDREGEIQAKNENFKTYNMRGKSGVVEYSVEVPSTTPWFESWRETSLKQFSEQNSGQYEFFGHFISCILVISTSEGKSVEDLTAIVGKLSKLQQQHQTEWPQTWLLSSVLKFYILLHDNSTEDPVGAEAVYQNLRTTYGGNFCYMLKINTVSEDGSVATPDPWSSYINQEEQQEMSWNNGSSSSDIVDSSSLPPAVGFNSILHPLSPDGESPSFLTPPQNGISQSLGFNLTSGKVNHSQRKTRRTLSSEDVRNIQTTVNEFLGKALLPYVERQCRLLHESIVNRRSMSKSFFGATKRLFGASAKSPGQTVYTNDSPEIVSRKLADLYFLFGHYSGAYHLYHQLKKDFSGDQAWSYYASALEMAAVSHFMMTQQESPTAGARSFPVHYISESIKYYIENCKMVEAAVRCTIMCCECLKELDNYPMAAEIYIRMTSEECDIRSALMLEQAAYAFLQMNSPRKFALHSVLAGWAGHRFGKAGLKVHSLNSYIQASQVYGGKGWRFAEDHVFFTIARQQSFLQLHSGLARYLKSLLKTPTPQPVGQVQIFYKELLSLMSKLYDEDGNVQELQIPKILSSDIRVRIGNTGLQTGEIHNYNFFPNTLIPYWDSLEEQVIREKINTSVIIFKPSRMLFELGTDNTTHPSVPSNEYFYIEIPFQNPLSVEVSLQNLDLKFDPATCVSSTKISELSFQPGETKLVRFAVASSREGKIKFEWLTFELHLDGVKVPFKQRISLRGPRLNSSKAERCGKIYAKDFRNQILVSDQMPLLQAEAEGLPTNLFHTQLIKFNLVLRDKSMDLAERKRISRVFIASDNMSDSLQVVPESTDLAIGNVEKNYCSVQLTLDGTPTVRIPCKYSAPQSGDYANVNLLILYEIRNRDDPTKSKKHSPLYRTIQMCIKVPLLPCLKLEFLKLKALDTVVSLDLLNIQNLTKEGIVELEDLSFTPSDLRSIEELNYLPTQEFINSKTRIKAAESLNIIMKTKKRKGKIERTFEEGKGLLLNLRWSFTAGEKQSDDKRRISGTYNLLISHIAKAIVDTALNTTALVPKLPFIFQVCHNAKKSHDFNHFPCYVCPVDLHIHPKHLEQFGKFELTIGRAAEVESETIAATPAGMKASSRDVHFIGRDKWLLDFDSTERQSHTITYKIAISRPGIFNVAATVVLRRISYTVGVVSDRGDANVNNVIGVGGEAGGPEIAETFSQTLHSPIIVAQSIFLTDSVAL